MNCNSCGSANTTLKEGVSKTSGKPYKGWKCNDCDHMNFVRDNPNPQSPKPAAPKPQGAANGENGKLEAMCMSYAKDIVVAQISSGITPPQPVKSVIWAFRMLYNECRKPGSVVFKEDAPAEQ